MFLSRHLDILTTLKLLIMTTLNYNLPEETKKKVLFVTFTNTKRLQWSRFRRYGF
jgi:hypothetical protein